jgi:hypothetical protein
MLLFAAFLLTGGLAMALIAAMLASQSRAAVVDEHRNSADDLHHAIGG